MTTKSVSKQNAEIDKVKLVANPKKECCVRDESKQVTEIIRCLDELVEWINEHEKEKKDEN